MKPAEFQKFLFRSAVTTIAVDGEIHNSEIEEIKLLVNSTAYFLDFEYEHVLKEITTDINSKGKKSVNEYLISLAESELSEQQKIILIDVILRMIEADKSVHPNEIQFLHLVKAKIKISEELLLIKFPRQIDYLLEKNDYGENDIFDAAAITSWLDLLHLVGFALLAYKANEQGQKTEVVIYVCLGILISAIN
jgi:uncharacterized tellurite resistance protein B-like protein